MLESCGTKTYEYWGFCTCLIEDPVLLQVDGDSASYPRRPEPSTIPCLKNELSSPWCLLCTLLKTFLFTSFVVCIGIFCTWDYCSRPQNSCVFELSGGATLQDSKNNSSCHANCRATTPPSSVGGEKPSNNRAANCAVTLLLWYCAHLYGLFWFCVIISPESTEGVWEVIGVRS